MSDRAGRRPIAARSRKEHNISTTGTQQVDDWEGAPSRASGCREGVAVAAGRGPQGDHCHGRGGFRGKVIPFPAPMVSVRIFRVIGRHMKWVRQQLPFICYQKPERNLINMHMMATASMKTRTQGRDLSRMLGGKVDSGSNISEGTSAMISRANVSCSGGTRIGPRNIFSVNSSFHPIESAVLLRYVIHPEIDLSCLPLFADLHQHSAYQSQS